MRATHHKNFRAIVLHERELDILIDYIYRISKSAPREIRDAKKIIKRIKSTVQICHLEKTVEAIKQANGGKNGK